VDIRSIGNLQPQPRVTERSGGSSAAASKKAVAGEPSSQSDSVEISTGAKEAQAVSRLVGSAQSSPDIRPEAVQRARETLERGGYEGVEVSREAAKNILGLL
ncbi:MAG: flagellar biosynthesis anti-sigma factor FlgM, partial [bacterium]